MAHAFILGRVATGVNSHLYMVQGSPENFRNRTGILLPYHLRVLNTELDPLRHIALPICAVDEFARVIYWNTHITELFGLPADRALGREWHTVVRHERMPGCCALCVTRRSLRNGSSANPAEVALLIRGSKRKVTMVPFPMHVNVNGGAKIGFVIMRREPAGTAISEKQPISIHLRVRRLDNDRMIAELTTRELQILRCVVNGMDARSIAVHLGITHATARNYVQRILGKLGVRNKAEAVNVALTYNLLAN